MSTKRVYTDAGQTAILELQRQEGLLNENAPDDLQGVETGMINEGYIFIVTR